MEPDPDRGASWVSHAVYMAELNFDNIKSFQYEISDSDELKVLIQVYNAVPVRKRIRDQINTVRSPFNMHEQSAFLNYWNCNQTFYLKGQSDRHDLSMLIKTLKVLCPYIKIQEQVTVQLLDRTQVIDYGKQLNSRASKFMILLEELRLPLKYAVLSLLSMNRTTIFNESLVGFINSLAVDPKWNSDKYAEYGGYLID
jgi:hypothetical protein